MRKAVRVEDYGRPGEVVVENYQPFPTVWLEVIDKGFNDKEEKALIRLSASEAMAVSKALKKAARQGRRAAEAVKVA